MSDRMREQVLAEEHECWYCGEPLDYHAPPHSRWAPDVVRLPSLHALTATRGSYRAVHAGCKPGHPQSPSRRYTP